MEGGENDPHPLANEVHSDVPKEEIQPPKDDQKRRANVKEEPPTISHLHSSTQTQLNELRYLNFLGRSKISFGGPDYHTPHADRLHL
jgi:hypothetical protein